MKIITLTLNPAYDVHCHAEGLELYHENLATVTSRDAGGKGINISRALTQNGVANSAVVVLGRENGTELLHSLQEFGIETHPIWVEGRVRENITVHTSGVPETRLSFTGFDADAALLTRVEEVLVPRVDADTVVTLTGRLPRGITCRDTKVLLERMRARGARIVIDSRSFSLSDLLEVRPWLIKPNEEEIAHYLGRDPKSTEDVLSAARELCKAGIENAMISLGGQGACLACREGCFLAVPPCVKVASTIGAGDSTIAGFLAATSAGAEPAQALRRAVAYGTAACLSEGTQPPRAEEIARIYENVALRGL